jgi:selenocysteine-specific elongation factor
MSSQDPQKPHVIVGTAGHIDHGKTALVKALTGIDADTLGEEKRRGITIELGFVFLDAPESAKQVVFIDVPGHEKLVKTMVAGASNIDAALLVVAADEGISVQTKEHFDILRLLDIPRGIVVLSKSDLVDGDRLEKLRKEVEGFARGAFLESAPVIAASAVSGAGIEELRSSLVEMAASVGVRHDSGVFRLPVDRVFTMSGFGTVTAGTVLSGRVALGERVEVYPEGLTSRVRGIQVHHSRVERSVVGRRTAINLPEIKKEELRRGQCVAQPGSLVSTQRLDGRLYLLKSFAKELKNRTRVRLHVGTAEVIGRLSLLESDLMRPGETGLVQFILECPTTALPGDRFVIRSFSPVLTIGGGVILDGDPPKHKRQDAQVIQGLKRLEGPLDDKVEQMYRKAGLNPQSPARTALMLGEQEALVREATERLEKQGILVPGLVSETSSAKTDFFLHRTCLDRLTQAVRKELEAYLAQNPYQSSMPLAELRSRLARYTPMEAGIQDLALQGLERAGEVSLSSGRVSPAGYHVDLNPKDRELADKIERVFRRGDVTPPLESEVREQLAVPQKTFTHLMRLLIEQERLIRLDDKVTYHSRTLHRIRAFVIEYIQRQGSITLAELRDALKFSRKYAQPILEYFDNIGLTSRVGDKRVLADRNGKA